MEIFSLRKYFEKSDVRMSIYLLSLLQMGPTPWLIRNGILQLTNTRQYDFLGFESVTLVRKVECYLIGFLYGQIWVSVIITC